MLAEQAPNTEAHAAAELTRKAQDRQLTSLHDDPEGDRYRGFSEARD